MIGCNLNGREVLHNDPDILQIAPYHNTNIDSKTQMVACKNFAEMYTLGGAKAIVHDDVTWQRWRKLLWNASFNTVCAITDIDSGAIQDSDALETLIRPAMRDIIAIAQASGVALPEELEDEMVMFTPKEARLRPSMQVDARKQSPMEIETILGNPLRVARSLGIQAKTLEVLYGILKVMQWKFLNLESAR